MSFSMIDYKLSRKCTTFDHLFNTTIFISNIKIKKACRFSATPFFMRNLLSFVLITLLFNFPSYVRPVSNF